MAARFLSNNAGSLDANGAGKIALMQPVLSWSKLTVLATSTGSGTQWKIGLGAGGGIASQVGFATAAAVQSGPYVLSPGETIALSITNGIPNDPITATFYGTQDLDPNDVGTESPSTTGSGSFAGFGQPYSFSVTNGALNQPLTLPPGTQSLAILTDGNIGTLTVTGPNGETLPNVNIRTTGPYTAYFVVVQPIEKTVTISFTSLGVTTTTIQVSAQPFPNDILTLPNTQLPVSSSAITDDALFGQLKSASFSMTLAAAASLDLVSAVASLTVYCVSLNFEVVVPTVTEYVLEDDAGVIIARLRGDVAGYFPRPLYGVPLTAGRKARLRNSAGANGGLCEGEFLNVQK